MLGLRQLQGSGRLWRSSLQAQARSSEEVGGGAAQVTTHYLQGDLPLAQPEAAASLVQSSDSPAAVASDPE